jgi:putative acetyltransferase
LQHPAPIISTIRTDSANPDFLRLVALLDEELSRRDGDVHPFYAQFNTLHTIRHVIVAYDGDDEIGCGAFREHSNGVAEIKRMFVHPSYRGKGIAGRILGELENWTRELHFHACVLETGFNQPEAIALYQKSGYSRIDNYGPYAGVSTSLCMKKEFSGYNGG